MRFDAPSASAKLKSLEIPVPDIDVLEQVNIAEGNNLYAVIEQALGKDTAALAYLKGVFYTIMPACFARIQQANLPAPTLSVLVSIGKSEGPKFAKHLKHWAEAGYPDSDQGKYLCTTYRNAHAQGVPEGEVAEVIIESAEIDAASRECTPTSGLAEAEEVKTYTNRHVYGGKVAVCFQSDKTKTGDHTIRIEAAEATTIRSFNWADKIAIQLSTRELPGVLATFLQLQGKFDGKGHGAQNDKWFTLENQPGKLFISVNTKGKTARSIPIGPGDCFGVVTLLMEQMLKNTPFLTADNLLSLIQRTAKMSQEA